MAMENDMQGTVNLVFIIDKNGRVKDVRIRGAKKGFGLDEEAIRVIKKTSGMWSPAEQRDRAVDMRFNMPVKFQLF
jgi:protein TonB